MNYTTRTNISHKLDPKPLRKSNKQNQEVRVYQMLSNSIYATAHHTYHRFINHFSPTLTGSAAC